MDILNECEKIIKEGEKFGECEIFVRHNSGNLMNIALNNVYATSSFKDLEICFRIFIDKKEGIVLANSFNEDIVKRAVKICKISKEKEFYGLPERNKLKYRDVDKNIENFEFENLKEIFEIFDKNVNLSEGIISSGISKSIILNSNGVECEREISYLTSSGICNTDSSTVIDEKAERKYFDIKNFFENLKINALKSRNPKKLEEIPKSIIFNQETFSHLISLFLESFNAYSVDKGESILKGKINEKIGNLNIDIIDDPYKENGVNSTNFDDEGCITKKNILMENGILKNYAYDWTMAKKFNVEPTGEAVRYESLIPEIGFHNIIIDKKEKVKEIFDEVNKGIYICSVMGMHTADSITTEFSLKVERSFYIEKGKMIPLKPFIINGKFIDLNIIAIDKNFENRSGVYVPNVLCENLKIS
ncbi:MAG: metallopeptidase TldD-related protein [Candidatus Altarchaeaceae archaeon]